MSFQNLEQIINLKVKITNLLDQILIGQIYTYSSSNEIIVLKTSDIKDAPTTYRIINTSFIKSIQVLPPFSKKSISNFKDDLVVPTLNVEDLKKSLDDQIRNYKSELVQEPTKTSPPAPAQPPQQQPQSLNQSHAKPNIPTLLFSKLVKLYGERNVKYNSTGKQNEIIVYDEVKITKPFTNTKANVQIIKEGGAKKHLDSVQRALKQFWLEIDNEKRGG